MASYRNAVRTFERAAFDERTTNDCLVDRDASE